MQIPELHPRDIVPEFLGMKLLVVQWLRTRLPMQGTRVQSLVQDDATCVEQLSPCATITEAHAPRVHAPQQEKPLQ